MGSQYLLDRLDQFAELGVVVHPPRTRRTHALPARDRGYYADRPRRLARSAGAVPVIPGRRNRKRAICCDKQCYAGCPLIENAFCRLKGFRVATRYDKRAANFLLGVAFATALAFRF